MKNDVDTVQCASHETAVPEITHVVINFDKWFAIVLFILIQHTYLVAGTQKPVHKM
jgi:hypothetical protein